MTEPLAPTTIGERQAIAEIKRWRNDAFEISAAIVQRYVDTTGAAEAQGAVDDILALRSKVATPTTNAPVADRELPDDVRQLVIAAREFWDELSGPFPESDDLDKALEAFASRVPYADQPEVTPSVLAESTSNDCLLVAEGWQDIASAPKDGTDILAWCVHPNAKYAGNLADKSDWQGPVVTRWIDHNGGGWTWHGMLGSFTHWRPLPAPPAVTDLSGVGVG